MSDLDQLDMLENKATVLDNDMNAESVEAAAAASGQELKVLPPLRDEIADLLDYLAMAGSFMLPTVAKHYNHDANLKIADAMIKLADRYGYDLRASLLSENSVVLLWVGVAYTVGMPAGAVYMDFKASQAAKAKNEKEVKATAADTKTDGVNNAVVTGAD